MKKIIGFFCWNTLFFAFSVFGLGILPDVVHAVESDIPLANDVVAQGGIGFEHVPGEVLVKFKKEVKDEDKKRAHEAAGAEVLSEIRELKVQRVKSKKGETTETLIEKYKKNPHVEYAEPNGIFRIQAMPDDPRFSELLGLHNTGQTITPPGGTSFTGTADADIDTPEAWDHQTGNSAVFGADIDTGVDFTHPDLAAETNEASNALAGTTIIITP